MSFFIKLVFVKMMLQSLKGQRISGMIFLFLKATFKKIRELIAALLLCDNFQYRTLTFTMYY